jgi:hypothetical protein
MAAYGLQFERQQQTRPNRFGGSDGDSFHLEPAIDLLTSYQSLEDFGKRHSPLSNESKLNLFLEIRSLILRQSQSQGVDHPTSSSTLSLPQVTSLHFLSPLTSLEGETERRS